MSYLQHEDSVQESLPIELYEFKTGEQAFRFTNADEQITAKGYVWKSVAIKRSNVKQTSDTFKDGVTFDFPISNEFAQGFLRTHFPGIVYVNIYRAHLLDAESEYITYWTGRAVGVNTSGSVVTISCESIFTSLKRPGLRGRFQLTCRHTHYGVGCKLKQERYTVETRITAVNTTGDTLTAALEKWRKHPLTGQLIVDRPRDHTFTAGTLLLPDGSEAQIMHHVGNNLVTNRRFSKDEIVGRNVKLLQGCNKTLEECRDKFQNLENFGGFPMIPIRNPYDGSIV